MSHLLRMVKVDDGFHQPLGVPAKDLHKPFIPRGVCTVYRITPRRPGVYERKDL